MLLIRSTGTAKKEKNKRIENDKNYEKKIKRKNLRKDIGNREMEMAKEKEKKKVGGRVASPERKGFFTLSLLSFYAGLQLHNLSFRDHKMLQFGVALLEVTLNSFRDKVQSSAVCLL